MDKNTLNSMKIDCRHKDEQIAFLRSQYPSETDRITNSLMIRSTLGFIASNADGTYNERRGMDNGSYTSAIRLQIYNIEKTCAAY
jgi:hypothetical protein